MTTEQVVRDQGHGWCAEAECTELATWLCGRGGHWLCEKHRPPVYKRAGYLHNRCVRCRQEDRSDE